MTSKEIAAKYQCAQPTVQKWAAANGVAYIGDGTRKTFIWTEPEVERFLKRDKPGRPCRDHVQEKQAAVKISVEDQVKKTTHDIEVRLGKGYRVNYAGKMKWTISPV